MATRPRAIDEYLRELERSLRDVPRDRRNEILTGIEAHIDALLADYGSAPSEADARNVLDRVGPPDEIAREASDDVDVAPVRRRWTDIAAVVALPFPFVGWIVGGVLLWMSDVWNTRDKLIGTLAGPGMFVLGGLSFVSAGSSGSATEFDPSVGSGPETSDGGGLGPLEVIVLFVVPVLVAIYLARKLRTPRESDGRHSSRGGPPGGDVSAIALLLLPFLLIVLGASPSAAVVFIVWSAGVVLLWLSHTWSMRERTLATLLAPGAGSLSLILLDASGSDVLGGLAIAIFATAALVPPIYLGRRLRGPEPRPRARGLAASR